MSRAGGWHSVRRRSVVIGFAIILDPINQLAILALAIPAASVACQFLGFCPIYPELAAKAADGPTRIEP